MRRALAFGCALLLLAGSGAVLAQTRVHTESKTKQTGPGPNIVTKTESVTGVVKEYRAGKKIEISGPNEKRYSFDLDEGVRIDGLVTVGQMARVDWVKRDGRERVTVIAPYAVGIRSSAGEVPKRPKSGTAETKTTAEVVVGTVKTYTAGRNITVNGPYGKDYSFELDQRVRVPRDVAVGRKVRIEYTKSGAGKRITGIALAPAGAR
jgi:hypothetical protein